MLEVETLLVPTGQSNLCNLQRATCNLLHVLHLRVPVDLFFLVIPFGFDVGCHGFIEGLFGIGNDLFPFSVGIVFYPVADTLVPFVFALHGDGSILMKEIIVTFLFTEFKRCHLFHPFAFDGIIIGNQRFFGPAAIVFFLICKNTIMTVVR